MHHDASHLVHPSPYAGSEAGTATADIRASALRALTAPAMAAAAGGFYALAQPPADLPHVAWVALIPLLAAVRRCASPLRAACCGLVFAIVFSALVAGWLPGSVHAFFSLSPGVAWLAALSVYVLFAGVPFALFGALSHRLLAASPPTILVGVPALWVAAELLRGRILGGLPWALLGHSLHASASLIQVADLGGVYAVSFVVAFVNTAVLLVRTGGRRRDVLVPVASAAGLLAAVALYGQARLAPDAETGTGGTVRVAIVQPNEAPAYRATQMAGDRALATYLRLSAAAVGRHRPDVVVWPENAIPFYLDHDPTARRRVSAFADATRASVILGAPARDAAGAHFFNAAHLVTPGVGPSATYRKQRLVPFAEYTPLRAEAVTSATEFSAGDTPTTFAAAQTTWGPTICLDLIYGDVVRRTVLAGAEVLVNLSNESWLVAGGAGAAAQQLTQAIFRAVETRRDVVRAVTTGMSGVIGANGIPRALAPDGKADTLAVRVSPRRSLTFYTRHGDVFAWGCVALAGLLVIAGGRPARAERD
jgi:apolipoprotein N-acyltransferase